MIVTMRERRIDVLDGWRAVSVALVIISHLLNYSSLRGWPYAHFLIQYGALGVQIFFVISGFVICRGFIRETAEFGRISLTAFYARRFFRIIPPLAIYVMTVMILAYFGIVDRHAVYTSRSLIFVCNFPNADCGGWLGVHTWSLSTEEQFYIVFPLMLWLLGKNRKSVITSIAIMLPFLCLFLYMVKLTNTATFLSLFVSIGFGVMLAMNEDRARSICSSAPQWIFLLAIGLLLIVAHFTGTPLATALNIVFIAPLVVIILTTSMIGTGLVSALLSNHLLRVLGMMSYGLYLWQQLATYAFPSAGVGFYAASISGCLILVSCSYYWFELPLIAIGRRLSTRIRGAAKVQSKSVNFS